MNGIEKVLMRAEGHYKRHICECGYEGFHRLSGDRALEEFTEDCHLSGYAEINGGIYRKVFIPGEWRNIVIRRIDYGTPRWGATMNTEDYHPTLNSVLDLATGNNCPPEFLGCSTYQYSAYVNFLRAISLAGFGGHKCWTKAALDRDRWTIEIHFPHCKKAFTRIVNDGTFIIGARWDSDGNELLFAVREFGKAVSEVWCLLETTP